VWILGRGFAHAAAMLPRFVALAGGRAGGRVAGRLAVPLRQRAVVHLVERLGVGPNEARRIADAMFEHLGVMVAELARLPRLAALGDAYVALDPDAARRFRAACADRGGVIVAAGHVGNWELMAARLAREVTPAVAFGRAPADPRWAAWGQAVRRSVGVRTFDRGTSLWEWRQVRRRRPAVGFLVDQNTRVPSVELPFFGAPARTPTAPARLAQRTGWPVVVATAARRPGGGHRVQLDWLEGLAGIDLLRAINRRLEARIGEQPEGWVWFHDRWGGARGRASAGGG